MIFNRFIGWTARGGITRRQIFLRCRAEGRRASNAHDWATVVVCYRKALAAARRTCDAHPFGATVDELAEIWVQLGHALKELRDVPGAENAYRSAVAMNGRNLGDAHFQLASLLLAQGNSSEAASCFFSTMKLDPVLAGRAREALLYLDYTASDIDDACVTGKLPSSPAKLPNPGFPLREIDGLAESIRSYPWFHSINLGDGIVTPGVKTLYALAKEGAAVFDPLNLRGRSLMDVGAWNGYFTVEARRRDAGRILAVDYITWTHPGYRGKESFDLVMSRLGIEVNSRTIDVQEISIDAVGCWDVVLFLGVFYHLLDPIAALSRLAAVTREVLVLETHLDAWDSERPAMIFYPGSELGSDSSNWWGPNRPCVETLLKTVGFPIVHFTRHPLAPERGFFHAFKSDAAYLCHTAADGNANTSSN
jgi:tRNA (mo5U34)-methyltransferase